MRAPLIGLSVLALGLSLLSCSQNKKTPGYEYIFSDMVYSVPYDAFAPNPVTRDKKTLQVPPEGTIPRGFMPYHYGDTPDEERRAERELVNTFPRSAENMARGKKVFETFCFVCHGSEGKGDGPVIPKFPAPPSLVSGPVKDYPAGRIFHVITKGFGLMPSYATQISPEDRWKLAMYVHTLQGGGPP